MEGGIEKVKEISPMFPRLHVKDAEKVGPKGPPRNKMALYIEEVKEKVILESDSKIIVEKLVSGRDDNTSSLLFLQIRAFLNRNWEVKLKHVSRSHNVLADALAKEGISISSVSSVCPHKLRQVGSNQGIPFCNSGVSCYMAEKLHVYQSTTVNFTKLMPDGLISSNNSVKHYEHDDALVTPVSGHGKNSCCSISKNEEDEKKLVHCESSCSLKGQSSFSERVNLTRPINLKSVRYEKNQIDGHIEVNHTDLPEEGSAHPLADFGDMKDESLIKIRTSKPIRRSHPSLMQEFRSISADSLKMFQGSNGLSKEENASFVDKINLRDGYLEKPATSGVLKSLDDLGSGRNFFWGKRDGHKSEDTYRHYDAPSKKIPDYEVGMKMAPEDVMRVVGENQFWKARTVIIKQQSLFAQQLFELHRLMKVQKLIAGSPNLFIQDRRLLSRKPPLKVSVPKKLQSDYVIEPPSSNAKLNNTKFEKPTPVEFAENTLLPFPGVNNMSKVPSEQLPNYGHHSENNQLVLPAPTNNTKPSPCYIYPAPGNQWLVPFMSPSEGLVYKPIGGTCPPNAGFMGPVYGACNPISLTPGNKGVQDATHVPYIFPPCGPPVMHSSTLSAFSHEQMNPPTKIQSKGTNESHQSTVIVNSAMLYPSSSNMSSQISQVMLTNVTGDNHTSEDKDLQISIGSSTPKRMKRDALPLFPTAPTFWASSDQQKAQAVEENQPRIIKAIPHNPNSTTESAARIFRSIQEERKYL